MLKNTILVWGDSRATRISASVRRQPERIGIRDQHIRAELVNLAQALRRVAGFADHINVRLVFQ